MLCSVIKHAGSGESTKEVKGGYELQASVPLHFLSAHPTQKKTKSSGVENGPRKGQGVMRYTKEFSRLTVVKTSGVQKRNKNLYDIKVIEVNTVNKRVETYFVGWSP